MFVRYTETLDDNRMDPPSLTPAEHVLQFEEAMKFKMVPHDFRVWNHFLFDKCPAESIEHLVNLYCNLLVSHNVGTQELVSWCSSGKLYVEARKRFTSSPTINFLKSHYNAFSTPPKGYQHIGARSSQPQKWFEQSRRCFTYFECEVNGSAPERYHYLLLGMIAWEIKPSPKWVVDSEYGNLDAWYYLGYAIPQEPAISRLLYRAYKAAFVQCRGISAVTFEEFNASSKSGTTVLAKLLDAADDDIAPRREYENLHRALSNFFKQTLEERDGSVWRLKQAISESEGWDSLRQCPHFNVVAQKFGFNLFWLAGPDPNKVYDNLCTIYSKAIEHSPTHLQQACDSLRLADYMKRICGDLRLELLSQTEQILSTIDHFSGVLNEGEIALSATQS